MTLDVFIDGYDVSFECSYSGFGKFRCEIVRGWNPELGRLHEQKFGFLWNRHGNFNIGLIGLLQFSGKFGGPNDGEQKINQILEEYDRPYNEGMKIFYHHSDCDGEISPEQCVLILKSFGRVDPNKFDKSNKDDYEFVLEGFNTWKKMLTYAIENNQSILFG